MQPPSGPSVGPSGAASPAPVRLRWTALRRVPARTPMCPCPPFHPVISALPLAASGRGPTCRGGRQPRGRRRQGQPHTLGRPRPRRSRRRASSQRSWTSRGPSSRRCSEAVRRARGQGRRPQPQPPGAPGRPASKPRPERESSSCRRAAAGDSVRSGLAGAAGPCLVRRRRAGAVQPRRVLLQEESPLECAKGGRLWHTGAGFAQGHLPLSMQPLSPACLRPHAQRRWWPEGAGQQASFLRGNAAALSKKYVL